MIFFCFHFYALAPRQKPGVKFRHKICKESEKIGGMWGTECPSPTLDSLCQPLLHVGYNVKLIFTFEIYKTHVINEILMDCKFGLEWNVDVEVMVERLQIMQHCTNTF